jgi:hypothetical protein
MVDGCHTIGFFIDSVPYKRTPLYYLALFYHTLEMYLIVGIGLAIYLNGFKDTTKRSGY